MKSDDTSYDSTTGPVDATIDPATGLITMFDSRQGTAANLRIKVTVGNTANYPSVQSYEYLTNFFDISVYFCQMYIFFNVPTN